jgi:hypothetical protein
LPEGAEIVLEVSSKDHVVRRGPEPVTPRGAQENVAGFVVDQRSGIE